MYLANVPAGLIKWQTKCMHTFNCWLKIVQIKINSSIEGNHISLDARAVWIYPEQIN